MKKVAIFLAALALGSGVGEARGIHGGTNIPAGARDCVAVTGLPISKIFDSSIWSSANIDTLNTKNAGFQWYFPDFYGHTADQTIAQPQGSYVNINYSALQSAGGGFGTATSLPVSPYFRGLALGTPPGNCTYVEAKLSFTPTGADFSFWSSAIEQPINLNGLGNPLSDYWSGQTPALPATYEHYIENDFFEYLGRSASFTLHDWYGVYGSTCPPGYCNVPLNYLYTGVTDFSQNHTYGMEWISATGSNQGVVKFYTDDFMVQLVSYPQFTTQGPPPLIGTSAFGIMDLQHLIVYLGIGGGNSGTPAMPVVFVRFWQTTTSGNLVN